MYLSIDPADHLIRARCPNGIPDDLSTIKSYQFNGTFLEPSNGNYRHKPRLQTNNLPRIFAILDENSFLKLFFCSYTSGSLAAVGHDHVRTLTRLFVISVATH
ncbi:hypothetical protein EAE99_008256 [Botrytis elliptica]|nr:hypothetical protein EAE99_008256 [Botrytis elliptica]